MSLNIQFTGDEEAEWEAAAPEAPALSVVPDPGQADAVATTTTVAPAVAPQVPAPANTPPRGLTFEGAPVSRTEIKLSGAAKVNTADGITVSMDDRMRVVGEFRVIKVLHYVDAKSGELVRQQVVAPVDDLQLTPWDPANPLDDGIVRVRP